MKEKNEKGIDADKAALLARSYFEKESAGNKKDVGVERSTDRIVADWREITVTSVKGGRKRFTVKCELYDEPSSSTRTKYTLKISKKGEIEDVSKESK